MIDKNLEKTLNLAFVKANQARFEFFTTEHVLLALVEEDSFTRDALISLAVDVTELANNLRGFLQHSCPKLSNREDNTVPTSAFHRIIDRASAQRKSAGKDIANGLHLLISMMDETESHAVYFLKKQNINKLDLMQLASRQDTDEMPSDEENEGSSNPLTQFCHHLNAIAEQGGIDPLIGREMEVERVIQVLSRRRKNNPILVGEAGVGKTAIAEGLAKKIVDGDVPPVLADTQIYAVDLGAMVAGTKYRGDFEKRVKSLISALIKMDDVIIFIDEIHTLLGAGATSDSTLDASNLLKPALSAGQIRCIGATTHKEYKQSFEKNAALARRFQKINIDEPSKENTVAILDGLKPKFEKFHQVKYHKTAIETAVELADKFIHDRYFPDKAIDLIDEAGASAKIRVPRKKSVSKKDIETVLAKMVNIPSQTVSTDDKKLLKQLEKSLQQKIFGQDAAITALVSAIKLSRAGLKAPDQPIGAFLFAGPTGVGKTEVAKQLAEQLAIQFVRFDMSEYMESHTVSRLIGSPPGYVGYDQGGLLTDTVANNPHCVLLLDEIEKAHPDIFNLLLQVMDYGKLTDSNGKTVNFSNVILIMTSNVGASTLEKQSIGFTLGLNRDTAIDISPSLKRTFSPEFRNRLSDVIQFSPLARGEILKIIDKFIDDLNQTLIDQGITLTLSANAKNWLLDKGYDTLMGARPMSRLINQQIKMPLSEKILFGDLTKGGDVVVNVDNRLDQLVLKSQKRQLAKSTT
ncbi:ATP-dependent Clp protease ATP-binding subunit ClpA [Ostreibacterium oceani]|uniref:ATP-dependent Clp protease ATP-binding subunit ClpA n=1 Tax=Ostreibacterium oceani TaxID=2654998 RepID=A0A6N7EWJ0_9GAMM|nr:ATP-dependent Clp protease ATP-binding subunit ClpA [Ostreibacterium oceani]MPV85955.1 ATP-dependent Clp protease ATP-binding subunit ClpA [Ostreibacterium oceani]